MPRQTKADLAAENAALRRRLERLDHKQAPPAEERHRAILEASMDGFWLIDPQGRFLDVNDAYCRMVGYTRDELLTLAVLDLEVVDTPADVARRIREIMQAGSVRFETRHRRKDGGIVDVEISACFLPGDGGRLCGFLRDVSGQKRDGATLRESERRFRDLLERIQLAAVILDRQGTVTFCNDFLLALTRYARDEVIGKDWFARFLPEAIRDARRKSYMEAVSAGTFAPHIEHDLWTARGDRLLMRWNNTLLYDSAGAVVGSASIGEEVTAIQRAEAAHRATEEALKAIIQASPLAIVALDRKGLIRLWNPAAERMFGWSEADVLGKEPPVLPEDVQAEFRVHFQELLGGKQIAHHESVRPRKDGSLLPVSYSAGPIRDAQGTVVGVVGLLADLTARKQLEAQLLHGQKMQALGRLAGGVAHDFNNHLLVITGFAEMLLEQLRCGHPVTPDLLDEIRSAGERAADLVRQLLAFSRKQVLQPKVLDLNAILGELRTMLERLLGEDIGLTLELQPDIGRIHADPSQIEQVILNLAVNARDAMPQGGTLTIRTAGVAPSLVDPGRGARPVTEPSVLLTVSDTGLGMDEETQAQIFEPFFTTKENGTGLGLATVYGIVEQSGGAVWVDSTPGAGTTFSLCFPCTRLVEPAARAEATLIGASGGAETILVVEDMTSARRLMGRILRTLGYTVLEAADGEQALSVAGEYARGIDLLLTDVVMPGMSGQELAEKLRSSRPGTRVLYVSGYADPAGFNHGSSGHDAILLQKPFTPQALARRIREVLDGP